MRKQLKELINKTIILEYDLPHGEKSINKTIYSTQKDQCYSNSGNEDLSKIIYNAIIEYSFNENELENEDYDNLHARAIQSKLKYNPEATAESKIKYGFFGEVILYCILGIMYKSKPLIARGYLYNPLENSETKGYDSFHIVEHNDSLELWFGEVKFYQQYDDAIDSIFSKIENVISDAYLNKNLIAIFDNHSNNLNIKDSKKINTLIENWKKNPKINISENAKQHNIKLVYPIMILFDEDKGGFDKSIANVIEYIEKKYSPAKKLSASIEVSIFFVLLPVKETKAIKTNVLEWISKNEPLMS